MHSHASIGRRQGGATVLTFALLLFLLFGFMGFALDLGHVFVVRSELQTSMDACALAAAQELDGAPDALTRARNAGMAAGNANGVNMQSANWSGQPKLVAAEIVFRDQDQVITTSDAAARYASCGHTQAGTQTPLLRIFGVALGSSAFAATMNVGAYAQATMAPGQMTCALPLALVIDPVNKAAKPPFGYNPGDWVSLLISQKSTSGGQIGWANLSGQKNSSESDLATQLLGYCKSRLNDPISNVDTTNGSAGSKNALAAVWNGRFGIYKKADDIYTNPPDYTGYGYTSANWPTPNAGLHCPNVKDAYCDFIVRRQTFVACGALASPTVKTCGDSMSLDLGSNLQIVVSGGSSGLLRQLGTNRRIAPVPVVNGGLSSSATTPIVDFACMLMLQPLPKPNSAPQIFLEYLGKASDVGSPCTTNGLPGGAAGPLVPVLVR